MKITLLDTPADHDELKPITLTRSVADVRVGIQTLREKWMGYADVCGVITASYLQDLYAADLGDVIIRSSLVATADLMKAISQIKSGEVLMAGEEWIACKPSAQEKDQQSLLIACTACAKVNFEGEVILIDRVWKIFSLNGVCLQLDFETLTKGKNSQKISPTNTIIGDHPVFLDEGARMEASIINSTGGPVYIGKDAEVMEGSMIRGPFAMGEHSVLKMGAKIYGATTLGPHCKVGGEVNNSVIMGYSNKAHDGFLGNSVIGEWCNLGADTNNSNLKNNYGNVRIFNYRTQQMTDTGLQFCGIFMGDHTKAGINTMFNTGSVIGVSCNVYGGDFPPKHLPNFSWGGSAGIQNFEIEKALEVARKMKDRRGLTLSAAEEKMLRHLAKDA